MSNMSRFRLRSLTSLGEHGFGSETEHVVTPVIFAIDIPNTPNRKAVSLTFQLRVGSTDYASRFEYVACITLQTDLVYGT
jgi:hypothetical protein